MAQEKRRDKRVREDFSILCRMYTRNEMEGDVSRILDISKSGLCFLGETQFRKNDIMQIMLRVPPDFREKIEIFGRIIESQKMTETDFKTRVAFIDILPETKTALDNIIAQASFREAFKQ